MWQCCCQCIKIWEEIFNEKDLVEKIYQAKSPIISAIGHKIDLSLTDLASDLSLQTPTEAGSYLVRNYKKIRDDINKIFIDIKKTFDRNIEIKELKLKNLKEKLNSYSLDKLLEEKSKNLDDIFDKIKYNIKESIGEKDKEISILKYRLDSLKSILDVRKKSIFVKDLKGDFIYSKHSIKNKDKISIIFSDGEVKAEIYD